MIQSSVPSVAEDLLSKGKYKNIALVSKTVTVNCYIENIELYRYVNI